MIHASFFQGAMNSKDTNNDPYSLNDLGQYKNVFFRVQVDHRLVGGQSTAVLVCLGQSNIASWAGGSYTPVNSTNHNFNIMNGGCYQTIEPMLGCQWAGTIPRFSNFITRLADKLITGGVYQRVILVPIAIGGTSADDWNTGTVIDCKSILRVCIARLKASGLVPTHFLWQQGENDAVNGTSTASYVASVNSIVDRIRAAGYTAPFFIAASTHWTGLVVPGGTNETNIINAYAQLIDHSGRVIYAGPNSNSLDDTNRVDGVHWNATGADANASLWVSALATFP